MSWQTSLILCIVEYMSLWNTVSEPIFQIPEFTHCLHPCLLACSLLLPCLRWHMAMFVGVLAPPAVDKWSSVKSVAEMWIKQNRRSILKTLLHSTTHGQKLHRVPLIEVDGLLDSFYIFSKITFSDYKKVSPLFMLTFNCMSSGVLPSMARHAAWLDRQLTRDSVGWTPCWSVIYWSQSCKIANTNRRIHPHYTATLEYVQQHYNTLLLLHRFQMS